MCCTFKTLTRKVGNVIDAIGRSLCRNKFHQDISDPVEPLEGVLALSGEGGCT